MLGLGPKPAPVVIPTLQPPHPDFVFPAKQTLAFTVDWRVFTAGTAVFQIEQEGTVQKISASGGSVGAVTMLFPVVDKFQAGFDTKTAVRPVSASSCRRGRRKVSSDLTFDYAQGKQKQVEKKPGERNVEGSDGVDPGLCDGLAIGDLLCRIATDGRGPDDPVSARRLHAHRYSDHESRSQRGDQNSCRNLSDNSRGANCGRGRSEKPRQYLGLVHR